MAEDRTSNDVQREDPAFDEQLSHRIKGAYDQLKLPEDSYQRMLGQLKAASAQMEAESVADRCSDGQASVATAAPNPAAKKRKVRVLRFALPAAACLLLALVAGVVAFTLLPTASAPIATMEASEQEMYDNAPTAGEAPADGIVALEAAREGESADEAHDEAGQSYDAQEEAFTLGEEDDAEPLAAPSASSSSAGKSEGLDDGNAEADASESALSGQEMASEHPTVMLESGVELHLVYDDGAPRTVDPDEVAGDPQRAFAYVGTEDKAYPCTVYEIADGDYAVVFEGSSVYYEAR